MKITILECKRVISRIILLGFLAFVLIVSVYDSRRNLDRYNVRDAQGIAVTWKDNLSSAKSASRELCLDKECMESLREDANRYGYLNGDNITELIFVNYERKTLEELSGDEMERFLLIRAETIGENLAADTQKGYTDEEIANFMDKAESLSVLSMEYAEGWKALAEKMGSFVLLIVIILSALVLSLFGRDPAVQMEELVRSARYGKRQLDMARITAAYLTVTVLYVCSMAIYFVVVMLPFGFDGADQPIQSNVRTFYSLYNITYFQQFLLNLLRGYVALIFTASLVLAVTILLKNMLAGASVIAIFLVTLVIFNQIYLYPVNHWLTNYMPVRMTDFRQFYTENELYRIGGLSIACMNWSIVVSLILSAFFLAAGLIALHLNRKKGLSG
ncbi:MAG: hypothetical protein J1E98_09370 [Lachnospiraceae bacterium]|nr:hypothetical protein [Lachnospiraceae bacterium]